MWNVVNFKLLLFSLFFFEFFWLLSSLLPRVCNLCPGCFTWVPLLSRWGRWGGAREHLVGISAEKLNYEPRTAKRHQVPSIPVSILFNPPDEKRNTLNFIVVLGRGDASVNWMSNLLRRLKGAHPSTHRAIVEYTPIPMYTLIKII